MRAYAISKQRLDLVQETLGQYLGQDEDGEESPAPPLAGDRRAQPGAPSADDDSDAEDSDF